MALLQSLRYAARIFWKQPGFAGVAVLTLALGIGATTAIFSVVYGVLLKSLPFHAPNRLVALYHLAPGFGGARRTGPAPICATQEGAARGRRGDLRRDGCEAEEENRGERYTFDRRLAPRSEERRVGKECRSRWSLEH